MKHFAALTALLGVLAFAAPTAAQWDDEGWFEFQDESGAEYFSEYDYDYGTYGYGDAYEQGQWLEDDYGYYDQRLDYQTNDRWFSDWYGDADQIFNNWF